MTEPALRLPAPRPPEVAESEDLFPTLGISATVVILGSSRVCDRETAQRRLREAELRQLQNPWDSGARRGVSSARRARTNARYYEEARRLCGTLSRKAFGSLHSKLVVVTGGGTGIMEAANRGAHEEGERSAGLAVTRAAGSDPNPYATPELSLRFRDLAARKRQLLAQAKALVVFPGGFGTLDELFEALTLLQTGEMARVPVLLFGREYWSRLIRFPLLAEEGMVDPEDLALFQYVESAEEAWEIIARHLRSLGFGEPPATEAAPRNTPRLRDVNRSRPARAATRP